MMANGTTTVDYTAFEAEVREFALANCPAEVRAIVAANGKLTRREFTVWHKALYRRGWGAPGWRKEYGGAGWDLRQRFIFETVSAECDCPPLYHHGLNHIGPVIMEFGTVAQRERYLPRILSADDWWCQGYSEPGAGSDLASLKTQAVRDGDDYLVTGQKVWTSHAHEADLMYTLVRTSTGARKQEGISMLLVPLQTSGITVRPIRTIDRWHHLNEVYFDGARMPALNLVGTEGDGWKIAKFLLARERMNPHHVPRLARLLKHVERLLEERFRAAEHPRARHAFEARIFLAEAELLGARRLATNAIDDVMHARPLGSRPSALKHKVSELAQRIVEIGFDLLGDEYSKRMSLLDGDTVAGAEWVHNELYYRSRTIAGGTTEIQRNVIARELFGS
jgi:alkylation response protein AidB-like acyl-CoA dehydrogenase